MKKYLSSVIILLFLFGANSLQAQFPALEVSADMASASSGSTVDISVRAGQNWQNITTFNGTISFDTTVITYNSMVFWGLSYPQGATFTYQGNGLLSFTWTSLITIGPTLMAGDPVFTLRFNVVGAGGSSSPVAFSSSPTPMFWANGFGWSGTNFNQTNGLVTVTCGQPTVNFSSADSLLSVSFADNTIGGPTSYLWDFGDGNTSTQPNPTHSYTTSGNYTVCLTATNSCGTDSSCQVVSVCSSVYASYNPSVTTVCLGDTLNLASNGTGGNTFTWKDNGQIISTSQTAQFTPSTSGNHDIWLVVGDGNCTDSTLHQFSATEALVSGGGNPSTCAGSPITITATNSTGVPTTYMWDQGVGAGQSPQVSPTVTTTYIVTGTDTNGCVDTGMVTVNVDPLPPTDAGLGDTSCAGDLITLTASGAPFYTWSNNLGNSATVTDNPLITTTYYVTGTSQQGCNSTDSVVVTVLPLPIVTTSGNATICEGESSIISVTGTAQSYVWDQGLGSGGTFTVSPSSNIVYTVTGTGVNGCIAEDSVSITVNPAMIADAGADVDICDGDSVTLMGSGFGGTGTFTYLWQPGNAATPLYTVAPSLTTNFTLTANDINGCSGVDTVTVTVHPNPVAAFTSSSTGFTTSFTDQSTGNIQTWAWDFGDNNTSSSPSPTHTYASNGNYVVTLTVTTSFGCTHTFTDSVSILVSSAEPFDRQSRVSVSPNPSQGTFRVTVDQGEEIVRIRLADVTGKTIRLVDGNRTKEQVMELSKEAAGLYLIEVETSNGKKVGRLIIE